MSNPTKTVFEFFNEVGIINQLATALFSKRLPDGLHVSHFSLLNNLVRLGDGKTPLALSQAFQVPKTTMTNTLMVLSNREFIDIRPNQTDKRSKLVFLTEQGRIFHQHAIQSMGSVVGQFSAQLNPEAIAELLPELRRIREFLDDHRDV